VGGARGLERTMWIWIWRARAVPCTYHLSLEEDVRVWPSPSPSPACAHAQHAARRRSRVVAGVFALTHQPSAPTQMRKSGREAKGAEGQRREGRATDNVACRCGVRTLTGP